jgi:predicted RNase H-like nuclease (RuvC/YqgF family)
VKVLEVAAEHFNPLEESITRFQFVRDEYARLRTILLEADPSHKTIVVDGRDKLRRLLEQEIEDLVKEHGDLEKRLMEASLHEQLRECHITRECMEELTKELSAAYKRVHTWREHAFKLKKENRMLLDGAKGEATPAAELEATVMDLQEQLERVEEGLAEYESMFHLPRKAAGDLAQRVQRLGSWAAQRGKLQLWDRNGKSLLVADTDQPKRRLRGK